MKYLFTMLLLFVSHAALTQTSLDPHYCYLDNDGDGYGDPNTGVPSPVFGCSFIIGGHYVTNGLDCNDADPGIHPGTIWYKDADNDGYSDGVTITGCMRPPGGYKFAGELLTTSGDCDDNDRYARPGQSWFTDADNDGYTSDPRPKFNQCMKPAGNYVSETQLLENGSILFTSCGVGCTNNVFALFDCNDNDPFEHPKQKWYKDGDGDKYASDLTPIVQCTRPAGGYSAEPEMASVTVLDCDDTDPIQTPGTVWYKDADADGFTDGTTITQCSRPANYKLKSEIVVNNLVNPPELVIDCDDSNADLHPFQSWYKDADGDKHGAGPIQFSCSRPAGYYLQSELLSITDCDDANAAVYPGAPELCDGLDNNCNGQVDEGVQTLYAEDKDGDGFGNNAVTKYACSQPSGYVIFNPAGSDCNDNDASINPASQWVLDTDGDGYYTGSIHTQCSSPGTGYILKTTQQAGDCDDNNAAINPATVWYRDADNDGYYTGAGIVSCTSPGADYRSSGLAGGNDCSDTDPTVNPGAVEVCGNKKDDNCNGQVDEQACYVCRNATAFSTTNITASSATLNWVSLPNPEQWQLQYKPTAPGGKWVDVILTGNKRSYNLTGLASMQSYNWHIKAKCSKNWTDYSGAVVFTTVGAPANRYITTADKPGIDEAAKKDISAIEYAKKNKIPITDLQAVVVPNPATANFKLAVTGNDPKELIKISVADMYGRIIEERTLVNEETITFGDRYNPGVYMLRVIQGKRIKQLRLVKLSR